jgi:hypothetical protein
MIFIKIYLIGLLPILLAGLLIYVVQSEENNWKADNSDIMGLMILLTFWPATFMYLIIHVIYKLLILVLRYIYKKLKTVFPNITNISKWIDKITNFFY